VPAFEILDELIENDLEAAVKEINEGRDPTEGEVIVAA
jgi:hypothetical protein